MRSVWPVYTGTTPRRKGMINLTTLELLERAVSEGWVSVSTLPVSTVREDMRTVDMDETDYPHVSELA